MPAQLRSGILAEVHFELESLVLSCAYGTEC